MCVNAPTSSNSNVNVLHCVHRIALQYQHRQTVICKQSNNTHTCTHTVKQQKERWVNDLKRTVPLPLTDAQPDWPTIHPTIWFSPERCTISKFYTTTIWIAVTWWTHSNRRIRIGNMNLAYRCDSGRNCWLNDHLWRPTNSTTKTKERRSK